MRLSILSVLSVIGAGVASALPQEPNLALKRSQPDTSKCVGSLLCCGTLTTPLDPVVDPLLLALGIDAANIVGSIGILCHGYEESSCPAKPQCCTEANILVSGNLQCRHLGGEFMTNGSLGWNYCPRMRGS
ncbi:unnamed protein product [Penicillium nalgiovense]|nr:unnamed protein product [Penicillium nalgiovense]